METLIVTGLSGAGKSTAIKHLEDMGYYCIDNMPPALLESFLNLEQEKKISLEKAAFVMDIRGREFFGDFVRVLEDIRNEEMNVKVLFLEATEETLVRRYKETRRVHPLAKEAGTNIEAIRMEQRQMSVIRENADFLVNTTGMKSAVFQDLLQKLLSENDDDDVFSIVVQSFGYKYGMAMDADIVFDARFIPNPYYVQSLRPLTGNNRKIREYVMKYPETQEFVKKTSDLILGLIPYYVKQGKRTLVIAFGCTGGQHRSVAMANEFSKILASKGRHVSTVHRDIRKRK